MPNDYYATLVQDRLKNVHSLVTKEVGPEHEKTEGTIATINRLHEKGPQEDKKGTANHKQKMKTLYANALAEAEQEEEVIRKTLEKIYEIRSICNERRIVLKQSGNKEPTRRGILMKALKTAAETLPLWLGQPGEKPPPLCGAVPAEASYVAKVGDTVAALQRIPNADDNWILAEVVNYNVSTNKYELDDIDEEQKEKISLSRRRVIPLPILRANPETHPGALFKVNSIVMALYPQTTCFYKAVISVPPINHKGEYVVLFEDPSYPDGYSPPMNVAQRYVIPLPHREKKAK